MSKFITVICKKKGGKVEVEGHGFEGTECEAAMKPIEDALAMTETEEEKKPEYYKQEEQHVRLGQEGG